MTASRARNSEMGSESSSVRSAFAGSPVLVCAAARDVIFLRLVGVFIGRLLREFH